MWRWHLDPNDVGIQWQLDPNGDGIQWRRDPMATGPMDMALQWVFCTQLSNEMILNR